MEQALGWLGWSPDEFWGATLREVHLGVVGFIAIKKAEAGGDKGPQPLTDEEVEELKALGDAAVRAEMREERRLQDERNRR